MSEIGLMFFGVYKVCLVLTAAILYSLGGRDGISKGVRRYGASAIIVFGTILFAAANTSLNLWYLVCYPLLVLAYSLDYGGDTLLSKILKRLKCAVAIVLACSLIAVLNGKINLLVTQSVVAIATSILLGVKSDIAASQEELLIGFTTCMFVPFYI